MRTHDCTLIHSLTKWEMSDVKIMGFHLVATWTLVESRDKEEPSIPDTWPPSLAVGSWVRAWMLWVPWTLLLRYNLHFKTSPGWDGRIPGKQMQWPSHLLRLERNFPWEGIIRHLGMRVGGEGLEGQVENPGLYLLKQRVNGEFWTVE